MFLSLFLFALNICETSCGTFEIQNTSAEQQNIIVQEVDGPVQGSHDIAPGESITLNLTAGRYVINSMPEQQSYRVTAQYCGTFYICPLSLPANIEYVDMGLPSGTYWANMNLGATEPYEPGCYFAFGETMPKEVFTWENYKYVLDPDAGTTTKYNYSTSWGLPVDGLMRLEPEDDPAHVHWGEGWQVPDMADITELINNVTFSVESRNGQKGMKVVSKINGNELFFPFAGYKFTYHASYNADGVYQSSELGVSMFGYYHVMLQTYDHPSIRFRAASYQRGYHRAGFSIRPVFKGTPPSSSATPPPPPPISLPQLTIKSGLFSIAADKKIQLAPGNLQYQASTGIWRFAEHQYDYVGNSTEGNVYESGTKCNNMNISSTYTGWIDLFGWTTSGYNGHYPWLSTSNNSAYCIATGSYGTNYDWGMYNAINNAGNIRSEWRSLSVDEWGYIFVNRPNATSLRAAAVVNGVKGYVLLPDDWVLPDGVTFIPDPTDFNTTNVNVYTASQWEKMENAGAIFLPAAGNRGFSGTQLSVNYLNSIGYYWTGSGGSEEAARSFQIQHNNIQYMSWGDKNRTGMSVRLAKDYVQD